LKARGIVKVPHLGGGGVPWYVDSRLVPNPASVAYITSEIHLDEAPSIKGRPKPKRPKGLLAKLQGQGRWVELGRLAPDLDTADYYAEQAGLPEYSGIFLQLPRPSDVVVIDTSARELKSLWQRLVLIESNGPLDNLKLLRKSLSTGRFYCEPSVDFDRPRFVMRFELDHREGNKWPAPDRSFRLGVYHPPLTVSEKRILVDGLSPYGPPTGKRADYVEAMAKAFELAVREFPVPKGVIIVGAVLARFEVPHWLENQHGQSPRKKGHQSRSAKNRDRG